MEKKEDKPIAIGAESVPFKFELSQLVTMRISEEWGEVQARAQYANGENQYLIHYQAADGRATTEWFGESMLICQKARYLKTTKKNARLMANLSLPESLMVSRNTLVLR
ncbi:TPA: hypothetical protein ACNACH_004128 [Escherichia coli]